jgi:hypothetical protein
MFQFGLNQHLFSKLSPLFIFSISVVKLINQSLHKQRLKSNLSFLWLSIVDQFMRLMEGSITGMKDCNWSINCSAVAVEIMICRAEDVRNSCSTA